MNKKLKVMIVPKNGSITSPIHPKIYIYIFLLHELLCNIIKPIKVIHKLRLKDFQVALDKLSVLKFPLVEGDNLYLSDLSCAQIMKC